MQLMSKRLYTMVLGVVMCQITEQQHQYSLYPLIMAHLCHIAPRKKARGKLIYITKHANAAQVAKVYAYARPITPGSIVPDIQGPCVGHCGQWHIVTVVPFVTPCCGVVLFDSDDKV